VVSNSIYDEPQRNLEDSSSPVETAPYSGLEPSTREPPPAPVVYDSLTSPDYVNTNTAAIEVVNGIICDDPHHDSEILLNTSISSEVETAV